MGIYFEYFRKDLDISTLTPGSIILLKLRPLKSFVNGLDWLGGSVAVQLFAGHSEYTKYINIDIQLTRNKYVYSKFTVSTFTAFVF